MKKVIIYILATMIMFLSLSTNSYAEESLQMYATSNVKNIIQSNMYDDTPSYMLLFGTENVIFDFNSMLPVYYIKATSKNPGILRQAEVNEVNLPS